VWDGAFDGACPDVEVLAAKFGVAHPMLMFGEIFHDVEQSRTTALVARPRLPDSAEGRAQLIVHLRELATPEPTLLLSNPRAEGVATLTVDTPAGLPELLGHVVPLDRHALPHPHLLLPPHVIPAPPPPPPPLPPPPPPHTPPP